VPQGEPARGEIHLRLVARGRLEADDGLWLGTRAHLRDVVAELGDPAGVPRGADLLEEPHGAELRVSPQAGGDDGVVGLELRGACRANARAAPGQIALQLPGRDPVIHAAAAHAQLTGNRGFGQTLVQQVFE